MPCSRFLSHLVRFTRSSLAFGGCRPIEHVECQAESDLICTPPGKTWSSDLAWYTSTQDANYHRLNTYLRQCEQPADPELDQKRVALDELFDTFERLPEDLVVYRGLDQSEYRGLRMGECIADKGFMSASELRQVGVFFAVRNALLEEDRANAVLLVIQVPAGQRALRLRERAEAVCTEAEVLLPRGTRIYIEDEEEMFNGVRVLKGRVC